MTDIDPDLVLKAYAHGIFPMAEDRADPTVHWVDPRQRGILPLDAIHVPRRLARVIRADRFAVRVDTAFRTVIEECAAPTPTRPATWINEEILELFIALHRLGHAHSVEAWRDGRLAGGLYGVSLGAAFFGESMFTRQTDASKVALIHLAARLRRGGYRLLDAQFLTEHLARFGAIEISRGQYRRLLRQAISIPAEFYSFEGGAEAGAGVVPENEPDVGAGLGRPPSGSSSGPAPATGPAGTAVLQEITHTS
jgi:leucyl/phenylalanyl-tRNA--protein transferase